MRARGQPQDTFRAVSLIRENVILYLSNEADVTDADTVNGSQICGNRGGVTRLLYKVARCQEESYFWWGEAPEQPRDFDEGARWLRSSIMTTPICSPSRGLWCDQVEARKTKIVATPQTRGSARVLT
jgi:hypothetical protein